MSTTTIPPHWWPTTTATTPPSGVVVVSANYNTKALIAQLLWSLHRFLGPELAGVVIVDNGSTDGSAAMLRAVADGGLCHLIANQQNRHHGPALTQGLSYLAEQGQAAPNGRPWVWLLDSDCMIARASAATAVIAAATSANAALVGEAYWNRWNQMAQFAGYSLLLDPAQVWRPEIGTIPDGGDPIGEFEQACRAQGLSTHSFPFAKDGYLVHLGRSTLAGVYARAETGHPLYEWATSHHKPHFQEVPTAKARHVALVEEFNRAVPTVEANVLIEACLSPRKASGAA